MLDSLGFRTGMPPARPREVGPRPNSASGAATGQLARHWPSDVATATFLLVAVLVGVRRQQSSDDGLNLTPSLHATLEAQTCVAHWRPAHHSCWVLHLRIASSGAVAVQALSDADVAEQELSCASFGNKTLTMMMMMQGPPPCGLLVAMPTVLLAAAIPVGQHLLL